MRTWTGQILAAAVALTLGVAPSLGAEYDPRGLWQTTTGESRYNFVYCGDGSKLCATLVWLNAAAMKSPASKQLGTYAYTLATHTAPNTWQGTLTYDGHSTVATITLATARKLTISGCYFFWCKSFDLVRISRGR
jgi:YD repeat-containing protein